MRALLSVSDKKGIVEFAKTLSDLGMEILSTGGTEKVIRNAGIPVIGVSDITDFPECLDGRVKTLHPAVHGGLLARRDSDNHMKQIKNLGIIPIDIVAINLYPFKETISKPNIDLETAVENIDIGGPAMLRSAAKNHRDVVAICDPDDYKAVGDALKEGADSEGRAKVLPPYEFKYRLALKVFQHTAAYDALIAQYLRQRKGMEMPKELTITFTKLDELRYGENAHQRGYFYSDILPVEGSIAKAEQLHGKELSFNNINDTQGALGCLKEFEKPAVVAVKHANPCGVAEGSDILEAFTKARDCDPVSIFGGIVACNREVTKEAAKEMSEIFLEVIIAPSFSEDALKILKQKANIRLMTLKNIGSRLPEGYMDIKRISGGLLIQDSDNSLVDDMKIVTKKAPTQEETADLLLAMKVVKHTGSNAVVFAKQGMTIAIGPGQTNRIWAVENAVRRSNFDMQGSVMASDAFFPFDDCVEAAARAGCTAIIQPGGSIRDKDSISKADTMGLSMIFSGLRHFKH